MHAHTHTHTHAQWEKIYLMDVIDIIMWHYHSLAGSETTSLVVKERTYQLCKEENYLLYPYRKITQIITDKIQRYK